MLTQRVVGRVIIAAAAVGVALLALGGGSDAVGAIGIVALLVALVALPFYPAVIAREKGHSFWLFLFFGWLIWPAAVVVALAIDPRRPAA